MRYGPMRSMIAHRMGSAFLRWRTACRMGVLIQRGSMAIHHERTALAVVHSYRSLLSTAWETRQEAQGLAASLEGLTAVGLLFHEAVELLPVELYLVVLLAGAPLQRAMADEKRADQPGVPPLLGINTKFDVRPAQVPVRYCEPHKMVCHERSL